MSQVRLLLQRRFWPLFWTQFLGAFNDNAFKQLVFLLALSAGLPWVAREGIRGEGFSTAVI